MSKIINIIYKIQFKKISLNTIIFLIYIYKILSFAFNKPSVCRFIPTCSNYMYLSVKKYGIFKGITLGIIRILRCNPWGKQGYDPLP